MLRLAEILKALSKEDVKVGNSSMVHGIFDENDQLIYRLSYPIQNKWEACDLIFSLASSDRQYLDDEYYSHTKELTARLKIASRCFYTEFSENLRNCKINKPCRSHCFDLDHKYVNISNPSDYVLCQEYARSIHLPIQQWIHLHIKTHVQLVLSMFDPMQARARVAKIGHPLLNEIALLAIKYNAQLNLGGQHGSASSQANDRSFAQ